MNTTKTPPPTLSAYLTSPTSFRIRTDGGTQELCDATRRTFAEVDLGGQVRDATVDLLPDGEVEVVLGLGPGGAMDAAGLDALLRQVAIRFAWELFLEPQSVAVCVTAAKARS